MSRLPRKLRKSVRTTWAQVKARKGCQNTLLKLCSTWRLCKSLRASRESKACDKGQSCKILTQQNKLRTYPTYSERPMERLYNAFIQRVSKKPPKSHSMERSSYCLLIHVWVFKTCGSMQPCFTCSITWGVTWRGGRILVEAYQSSWARVTQLLLLSMSSLTLTKLTHQSLPCLYYNYNPLHRLSLSKLKKNQKKKVMRKSPKTTYSLNWILRNCSYCRSSMVTSLRIYASATTANSSSGK